MKTSSQRLAILILAAALTALFSSGCGTVHGFGRDVEKTGDKIQHASR
ncbi:MAG: entericidin A/B family lipoprotein [Luteolibacter sp.]